MSHRNVLPGINIQWPWSELIISGEKTIETRSYPIPTKHIGKTLAVIQTPGPRGKKEAGIKASTIIGTVVFSKCYRYASKDHWKRESNLHKVDVNDPSFKFKNGKVKWAWVIQAFQKFDKSLPAPKKRGIVFASKCIL